MSEEESNTFNLNDDVCKISKAVTLIEDTFTVLTCRIRNFFQF